MADRLPQMLRSDARDNRDRAVQAARALFAEHGMGVTMREVARRAGVGPATLYRRFPTKEDLIDAAFAQEIRECREIVEEGCADPDPWRGLRSVIERITALNARNQGFVDTFLKARPDTHALVAHRAALVDMLRDLVRRARASGGLRADADIDDVVLVLNAGRALASGAPPARARAARRFAVLAVDALRARADQAALTEAPRRPGGGTIRRGGSDDH